MLIIPDYLHLYNETMKVMLDGLPVTKFLFACGCTITSEPVWFIHVDKYETCFMKMSYGHNIFFRYLLILC